LELIILSDGERDSAGTYLWSLDGSRSYTIFYGNLEAARRESYRSCRHAAIVKTQAEEELAKQELSQKYCQKPPDSTTVMIKAEKYEITVAKIANKNLMSALAVTFVDPDWR
jgi:hypothetical protein